MDIAFADFISTLVKTKIANKYRKPFSSYDSDSESSLTWFKLKYFKYSVETKTCSMHLMSFLWHFQKFPFHIIILTILSFHT